MIPKALVSLLVVAALSAAADGREVAQVGRIDSAVAHAWGDEAREPGDLCDGGVNDYYWTVSGWFTGEETYDVYCDPDACEECSGKWRPISVTVYLFWEDENSCSLTISATIRLADEGGPACAVPGATVCWSDPVVAGPFSPAGLWAVTIPFPEESPTLGTPFFASLTFEDTCDEMPDLVADRGPCDPCRTWNDWGIGRHDLCEYGFPGNLSAFATMECQGPSAVQEASWSTIKNLYRDGD